MIYKNEFRNPTCGSFGVSGTDEETIDYYVASNQQLKSNAFDVLSFFTMAVFPEKGKKVSVHLWRQNKWNKRLSHVCGNQLPILLTLSHPILTFLHVFQTQSEDEDEKVCRTVRR